MIDLKRKVVFIHIIKCGGSSIEALILNRKDVGAHEVDDSILLKQPGICDHFPLGRHATLKEYEGWLKEKSLEPGDFTFFTLVRNPISIFYSMHSFRIKSARETVGLSLLERVKYSVFSSNVFIMACLQAIKGVLFGLGFHRFGRGIPKFGFYLESKVSPRNQARVFRLEDLREDSSPLLSFLASKIYNVGQLEVHNKSNSSSIRRSRLVNWILSFVHSADIKHWDQWKGGAPI